MLVIEPDGGTRFADAPRCPPLGAAADSPSIDHEFVLPPGATLVLYTDGLIESRTRSIDTGLRRLAEVARTRSDGVERLADDIVDRVPEQRQDNIAVLALRRAR